MIDLLAPGFLYSLAKDVLARTFSRRRKVELRKKWKAEFEPRIWDSHKNKLRQDVIIRDMKRIDNYPDVDEKSKNISPWFRAGLVGTYHRGIYVGLTWEMLTKDGNGERWRKTNYEAGETGDINVLLIGSIPFENIDNVDWDGDEFYGFPHIYCFFSYRKEPYQHVGYYTEATPPNGILYRGSHI